MIYRYKTIDRYRYIHILANIIKKGRYISNYLTIRKTKNCFP